MFHGCRWLNDTRFSTPMISSQAGHVFIGDFINYNTSGGLKLAKVKLFYQKVLDMHCM